MGGTRPADLQVARLRAAPTQRDQEVARIEQRLGAVAEERVAPRGGGVPAGAGQREDVPAVLGGVFRRDAGPAHCGGLDHHDDVGQRRDDAIAHREPLAPGLYAVAVLTDDEALLPHPGVERTMSAWIHDVEAGRDDTDREPAGVERAQVSRGIDSDRESAHDRDPGISEESAQLARRRARAASPYASRRFATRRASNASGRSPSPSSTGGRSGSGSRIG